VCVSDSNLLALDRREAVHFIPRSDIKTNSSFRQRLPKKQVTVPELVLDLEK
jgi:hypothetical protein